MQKNDLKNGDNVSDTEMKSMPKQEQNTLPIGSRPLEVRTRGASNASPIVVSAEQFSTVREEHLKSMDLLNCSANALLGAMEGMVPNPESGRIVGEHTAQGMRQLAKSICDIVQTKTNVVRSMYSIARDEM